MADNDLNFNSRQPSKRLRYVLHACNECKRRKVKCDGAHPCARCVSQDADCSYHRRRRGRGPAGDVTERDDINEHMRQMQSVLDTLVHQISPSMLDNASTYPARATARRCSPTPSSSTSALGVTANPTTFASPPCPGPTSSEFTFDVVKRSFRAIGIEATSAADGTLPHIGEDDRSDIDRRPGNEHSLFLRHILQDVLWKVDKDRALHLIQVFANGPGLMYPVVNVANLLLETETLFTAIVNLQRLDDPSRRTGAAETMLDYDGRTLKLVLAIGLTLEQNGVDKLAELLFDSIRDELTIALSRPPNLSMAVHSVLTALLHFHLDEETIAGRFVSIAARSCVELGLNRQRNILRTFPDAEQRYQATTLFWCVYMLDRRGSIGLGVPFVLQDIDIDTAVPDMAPGLEILNETMDTSIYHAAKARKLSAMYVSTMINFTRLSGKACHIVNKLSDKSLEFPGEEIDFLDYQVQQWYKNLPVALQLPQTGISQSLANHTGDELTHFLRVVLKARTCQLRTMMFRPVLYFPNRINTNLTQARTAIEVAKELVQLLWTLNEFTTFVRSEPVFFKHFLKSSFGVLLLAVANAWEGFGQQVSHEFYLALELFKVMSSVSELVKRYWKTINGLEELAHKLGLPLSAAFKPSTQDQDWSSEWNMPGSQSRQGFEVANPNLVATARADATDADGIRAEFATFFDPSAGYSSSLFDFPLNEMFSTDLSG